MALQFRLVALLFAISTLTTPLAHANVYDDLFAHYNQLASGMSLAQIADQNRVALEKLAGLPISGSDDRLPYINASIANEIFTGVFMHPVAGTRVPSKYDPSGDIGFCFGRAMTAHLEALYRGIMKESIKKIWAIGDLRTSNAQWRYHVTTILKGPDKLWYAIDPVMGSVLTADQWYKEMKRYDSNGKMKIYITEASKFGPSTGVYEKPHFLQPFYNEYFRDLLAYYRQHGAVSGARLHPEQVR